MENEKSSMLSVCITAFDQHEITVAHVRECMNSSLTPKEIVVVNDHGDPSLRKMLLSLEKTCPVIYAYVEKDISWNYTGARNLAVWLSTGEYLAMEDNDHIPTPTLYEEAIKILEENPDIGRICSWKRIKRSKEDVISKPQDQWEKLGITTYHRDTNVIRRDVFLQLKGCDEQFAGRYAWACADWRRRLQRANIQMGHAGYYNVVIDGETHSLVRRKSYKNYELARNKTHIQPPKGILNFTYSYERML